MNQNTYYRVVAPFDMYIRNAYCASDTHAGDLRLLDTVWRKVTLAPGDEVHDLGELLLVVTAGAVHEAAWQPTHGHLLERAGIGPQQPQVPEECVEALAEPHRPRAFAKPPTWTAQQVQRFADPIADSDDWLLRS